MTGSTLLKNSRPKLTVLFAIIILALDLVVPGIPFSYSTLSKKTREKEEVVGSLENESKKLRIKLSSQKETLEELAVLRERWEEEKSLIPEEPDIPSILAMISLTATGCGVTILLVKPEQKNKAGEIVELPVSITVAGGYHETARFISDILNLPRLLTVSHVKLASYTKGGFDETVETTMLVTGYALGGSEK